MTTHTVLPEPTVARWAAGQFPPLPEPVAPLLTVNQATTAVRMSIKFNDISAFTGDPGNGKTTAASLAVQIDPAIDWRYCVPPQRATTKAMMEAIYTAVFGYGAGTTERHITSELSQRLAEGDIGLVIDEVHHVGVVGMQQLRHLHDLCTTYSAPFPMLLVGCGLRHTLVNAKEVRQRIARWVNFDTIQNPDDLRVLIKHLHPRLAALPFKTASQMNAQVMDGAIRSWVQLAKHIDLLPSTESNPTAPLSRDEIRQLRTMLGV